MYVRIVQDWDGLRSLAAAMPLQLQPALPVARRLAIPSGSVVPAIRARPPAKRKRITPADVAVIQAMRNRVIQRAALLRAMPTKQITAYARSLRGFLPPRVSLGSFGIDTSDIDSLTAAVRDMSQQLADVTEEIRQSTGTTPESLQQTLGALQLSQRAGDFSAALGFDVVWQDLEQNCARELGRLNGLSHEVSQVVMAQSNFAHIAAVFKDQGWNLGSVRSFLQDVASNYESISEDFYNIAVGDSAAFGEGGLRRMIEDKLATVSAELPEWLTTETLSQVGNAAQAWIGAAGSGRASDYVMATGATVSMAGLVIPQPVGAIVSAVGGLISLIGSWLGDEKPAPLPPELVSCTGKNDAYNVAWAYNPEAWAALAFCIVAKEGFEDSPTLREARSSRRLVQEVVYEAGWWCTIDRYSGEVMVREPTGFGRPLKPLRRLLDVFDRKAMEERGLDRVVQIFDGMANDFGCVPHDEHWQGAVHGRTRANFLYCYPNVKETFTRFMGSGALQNQRVAERVLAFRRDWTGSKQAPEHIGSDVLLDDSFWATYRAGLVASIYLGGTVPYGIVRGYAGRGGVVTGVGVGGADVPYVDGDRTLGNIGYVIFKGPSGMNFVNDSGGGSYRPRPLDSLRLDINGAEWAMANRVALPSPDVQIGPGNVVSRASHLMQFRPLKFLRPIDIFHTTDKEDKQRNGTGMSTGAKVALGFAVLALVGGGGYYLYKRSKEQP